MQMYSNNKYSHCEPIIPVLKPDWWGVAESKTGLLPYMNRRKVKLLLIKDYGSASDRAV
jgi:hypothetical protein